MYATMADPECWTNAAATKQAAARHDLIAPIAPTAPMAAPGAIPVPPPPLLSLPEVQPRSRAGAAKENKYLDYQYVFGLII